MEYFRRMKNGMLEIAIDGGEVVALFPYTPNGQAAYSRFVRSFGEGDSLYCEENREYVVGTLDQLMANCK